MEEKRPISRAEFQVSNGDALPCRGCGMIPAPQVWAAQWLPPRGLGGRGKRAPSQGRNLAHHAQGPPSGADTSQTAVAMPDGRTPGEVKPAVKAFQNQPVSPKHKGTGNAGFHGQEGRTSGVDEQHESLGKCWATFFMTCKYSRLSCVWNVVISSMFWQRWGVKPHLVASILGTEIQYLWCATPGPTGQTQLMAYFCMACELGPTFLNDWKKVLKDEYFVTCENIWN